MVHPYYQEKAEVFLALAGAPEETRSASLAEWAERHATDPGSVDGVIVADDGG